MNHRSFQPDLIIEATKLCDRACAGCYAPNVIASAGAAASAFGDHPEFFLDPARAESVLKTLKTPLATISIRGGEPSLHPDLPTLLEKCLPYADQLIVETHGRWLLKENIRNHRSLLTAVSHPKVAVKLSFDRMHGLSSNRLMAITDYLGISDIHYLIAITESSDSDFQAARARCSWIPEDRIIYQPKGKTLNEFVAPKYGVVTVQGQLAGSVTAKESFFPTRSGGKKKERIAV